jgi:5-methyltetrahydrofolate--homocysteine methyltransferase
MSRLLEALSERVLLCDGAMGSRVQVLDLDLEKDFWGRENCTEVLNLARPDLVIDIHKGYYAAGADMVETNTFGGSPITLAEFGLQDKAHEINKRAAEHAREAAELFKGDGRERFVLGSVGPGTRLPSLGHIGYDEIESALGVQCAGLIAGGVDGILIETCQDPLQIKAAVNAAKAAIGAAGRDGLPIIVQVTVETTGTLLVGSDIAAAATVVHALDVPVLGLNCATGPQEMAPHLQWLGENWPGLISVQPNAGRPELIDGRTRYPLGPDDLAKWLDRFLNEDGVNLIGGCCGTTDTHIAALDAMLRRRAGEDTRVGARPAPVARKPVWIPGIASLYGQSAYRQENAYLSIGERCNANGSRRFRQFQADGDWDGCIAIGVEQVKEGSHGIDVCTAFVGRDEVAEMTEVVSRMRGSVDAPLVFDSTELPVLETAMKLYGGKPLLNSINFEDGEEAAEMRVRLARKFGAGVIALTIDEGGMAKERDHKVAVAKRLYDFACVRHGLPPEDLIFDPLTFTICTGNEDDRKLGLWTLEAIERIAEDLPECQILLGLSNISFGLNPPARHVLNSVFLDHAIQRGLTGAILHMSKIMPLHKIPEQEAETAEDLIFDRRRDGYDPLHAYIALFEGRTAEKSEKRARADDVETRLKERIIDGERQDLEADLDEALQKHSPLDIVNIHLLDGMKVVGDLFGAGKMQLPFVLQSAETMKAAVRHLEPHMEKAGGREKGTIVLATVRGDVHDIGKNLVDIILTNNGYKVVNLGIKQPIENIVAAVREHEADAVGMSGLLVKSTVVMRDNLERMNQETLDLPVVLGGAALTRNYVEGDCAKAYACGRIAYARDAFDGLSLMEKVVNGDFDDHVAGRSAVYEAKPRNGKRVLGRAAQADPRPADLEETRLRRRELAAGVSVPEPPFWGPRVVARVPVDALVPYLNERMLYQFQWGYRKNGRSLRDYMAWARKELRPILKRMMDVSRQRDILMPQAVYGYWPAYGEGNDVVLCDPADRKTEVGRFILPRQAREDGLCIADFLRDGEGGERDVIGLQVVTIGQRASDIAREWFAENRYQDYLYLHGLGVELAEALAEYIHKRIREELGFGHEDARDLGKMLQQGYRGSRYSFGYPACPKLEDQTRLLGLLGAERIGVELSDEFQLHPEQSTSAIVLHHPQARYFSV